MAGTVIAKNHRETSIRKTSHKQAIIAEGNKNKVVECCYRSRPKETRQPKED